MRRWIKCIDSFSVLYLSQFLVKLVRDLSLFVLYSLLVYYMLQSLYRIYSDLTFMWCLIADQRRGSLRPSVSF